MWPRQYYSERKNHLLPSPGTTLPNALLTDVLSTRTSRVFSFQLLGLCCAVIPSQGKNFAFLFVEAHEIPVSSFLQSVDALGKSSTAIWFINHSVLYHPQTCWRCSVPSSRWLDDEHPSALSRGVHCGPSAGLCGAAELLRLPSTSLSHFLVHTTGDTWEQCEKQWQNLAEFQTHRIDSCPLIHQASHLTIEGSQVGETWFPLYNSMQITPSSPFCLQIIGNGFHSAASCWSFFLNSVHLKILDGLKKTFINNGALMRRTNNKTSGKILQTFKGRAEI